MTERPTQHDVGDEEQPREHPQDPAEGARDDQAPEPRQHSQDPAEGGDDSSATG